MLINKLTSTFGDHSNLLPLFTKDIVNSAGMTAFSYNAGGEIEAKDRFIDEFGTQAIWMGGLPFFKLAFDLTAYKLANLSPDVDVRLLKDVEQLGVAQKYAASLKDKKISETLNNVVKHAPLAKGLFLSKFASATILTLASFFTLVKVKQHYTHKEIEKAFWARKANEQQYTSNLTQSPAFKAFNTSQAEEQNKNNKNVAFKGLASSLSAFMFDPVKNLLIVDAGITGERLAASRTKTEFVETGIKEFGLLTLLYVLGPYIQSGIEKISEKMGKPIGLHAEILSSEYMKNNIKNGSAQADVNEVKSLINAVKTAEDMLKTLKNTANTEQISNIQKQITDAKKALFEFVYSEKAQNNTVIKAAKHSGTIKTIINGNWWQRLTGKAVNTHKIDPHKFISISDLESVANNINKLSNQAITKKDIGAYLKKCRNMKIASVAANMGITCLLLGLIVPFSMMKYRAKQQNGNKEFHVQSEIEKQLEQSFKARMA